MKRAIFPALMISLLLSACGGGLAEERLEQQREIYAAASALAFTAKVTANLDSEVFQCTLACTGGSEGVDVTVTAPETVAGIKASLSPDDNQVTYAGVQLAIGNAAGENLSPVWAMGLIVDALRDGHIIRAWQERVEEKTFYAAEIYAGDDDELTIWYDGDTLSPLSVSIARNGVEQIRCEIEGFTYENPRT